MNSVASVATLNAELDMAADFIHNFHLLSHENVKGTCWEAIHASLPLPPLEIARRVCEVLSTSERLPTLLESLNKE